MPFSAPSLVHREPIPIQLQTNTMTDAELLAAIHGILYADGLDTEWDSDTANDIADLLYEHRPHLSVLLRGPLGRSQSVH